MLWATTELRKGRQMPIDQPVRVAPAVAARVRAAADTLKEAPLEGIARSLHWLSSYIAAPGKDEELEVMQEGLEAQPLPTEQFLAVLAAGISLAEMLPKLSPAVSKAQWLDSVGQSVLSSGLTPALRAICEAIFEQRDVLEAALAQRTATRGAGPSFDSVRATVELRAVFPAANLERRPTSLPSRFIPVASVTLWLDSGNPDAISFQANRAQLARLVSDLQLVLDQLDLAADAVSGFNLGG